MKYYGFTTPPENEFIIETSKKELKKGGTYLEMGVFAFGTIGQVAEANRHATCWAVDRHDHRYLDDPENSTRKMLEEKYPEATWTNAGIQAIVRDVLKANPNIKLSIGNSRALMVKNCQMQFIDADHSYENAIADFWHAWHQAAPGSLILGHDLNWEGVERAVFDIAKILGNPGRGPDSLWYYRKK